MAALLKEVLGSRTASAGWDLALTTANFAHVGQQQVLTWSTELRIQT
jgi:hypothetical protein